LASVAALLVLATLAAPAQAADVDARLGVSAVGLEVPAGTTLAGQALALGVNSVTDRPGGWEFRAERVHLAEHHTVGTSTPVANAQDPANPDRSSDSVSDFGPAYGFTTAVSNVDRVYFTVTGASPMAATALLPALPLSVVPKVHFDSLAQDDALNGATGALPLPHDNAPPVDLAQPALHLGDVRQETPLVLHGDLSLFVYAFNFTIKPDQGEAASFHTGAFDTQRVAAPASVPVVDLQPYAGRYDRGRALLQLTNATLTYRPGAAPYQLDLAQASLGVAGNVRLQDAQGSLEAGGRSVPVRAATMTIGFAAATGDLRPTQDGSRMDGLLAGRLRNYSIDGRSFVPDPASPGGLGGGWPGAALAVLGVAGLAMAALYLRRRRAGVDLLVLQAEEAFSGGHFKRALAASRQAVRRAPRDMDALVLRCLTRLRLGQPQRAAAEIGGVLAAPEGLGDPGTLHLLLSLCQVESGQEEDAYQSLARALAIRPDLGDEVRRSPLFRRVLERPELRALLGHEGPSSYA
jgi:hypothetical protein